MPFSKVLSGVALTDASCLFLSQRIQDITRMTYEELMKADTKEEFVRLFKQNIKCVKSVDECPPDATLMMNRKKHKHF